MNGVAMRSHGMVWGLGLLLAVPLSCLSWSSLSAAEYSSRVRTLSGLRLDLSVPLGTPDMVEGVAIDQAFGLEVISHHRRPFHPSSSWRLYAAMGLFSTYQSASVGATDLIYIGTTARAALGISYDITDQLRLELVPHIGLGVSYLDPGDDDLEVQEPGLITEYGLRLAALLNLGQLDLGAGIGYTIWRNNNRFLNSARQRVEIDVDQDYPHAFVTIGWHF